MSLKLLSFFIFSLFLHHTSTHAMKRIHAEDEAQQDVKRPKIEYGISELKWYSYAEIMTFIYKIKAYSLRDKFKYLCADVLSATKTVEGEEIYQAWISMPSGEDLIVSVLPKQERYDLYVCKCDQDEKGHPKPGAIIFSSLISFAAGDECIKNMNNALEPSDSLVDRMFNELLFSVQPNFVHINECMSQQNFCDFLTSLKEKNLLDKMTALNNGGLGTSNSPLKVKFKEKENVILMLEVSIKPYSSNCLAESNFLTEESGIEPNTLFYYFLTVSVWNEDKKSALDLAAAILVFPLDAGYGDPHLPSEVNSICRSENLSGTEILSFIKQILCVIQPKKIYLNDASSIDLKSDIKQPEKSCLYLRIVRSLAGGQTFYAEYAQFEVLTCENFKNHHDISIHQSREKYEESLNFLRNYKIRRLKLILNKKAQDQIVNILKKYSEHETLSECLNALFKLYRSNASSDFLDLYFVLISDHSLITSKNSRTFSDHIQVIWDTCVWESTAYQKPIIVDSPTKK